MHFQSIQRQSSSIGYNTFEYTTVCSIFDKGYRYGFNGKEKDNEINVNGGDYDFGARIYDGRLGRWLSLDPLQQKYPSFNPYNFVHNSPIIAIDPDGKLVVVVTGSIQGYFLFAGASAGAGFAIGNDGIAFLATFSEGLGIGFEASASVNVGLYPFMKSVNDLNGWGKSLDAGGAVLGKAGVSVPLSNNINGFGAGVSIGAGLGAHLFFMATKTSLKKISWDDMSNFFKGESVTGLNNNLPMKIRQEMKLALNVNLNLRWNQLNNQIIANNKMIKSNNAVIEKYKSASIKEKKKLEKEYNKAINSNAELSKKNDEAVTERKEIDEIKKKLN